MKFDLIMADNPWPYKVWSKDTGHGRIAEAHYRTMSIEDLCRIPVGDIAAKDCVLFFWVTSPVIPEALDVLRGWGFTYKTVGFYWCKTCKVAKEKPFVGLGHITRANVEQCWVATRGKGLQRVNKGVRQVLDEEVVIDEATFRHLWTPDFNPNDPYSIPSAEVRRSVMSHSAKPPEVRTRIEQLYGDVKADGTAIRRLELFARNRNPFQDGWHATGLECDGKDVFTAIEDYKLL